MDPATRHARLRSGSYTFEFLWLDGQGAESLSGGDEYRVHDGRGDARYGQLTDTTGVGVADYERDIQLRYLIHSQRPVVVEVALLDTTVFQRYPAVQCRR